MFTKLKSNRNPKTFLVEVIKTVDKIIKRLVVHYPKTMLIVSIASLIFTVIFPNILTFIGLGIDCCFFYRYHNYMFTSIKAHKDYKVSEWFSKSEDKMALELYVYGKIYGKEIWEKVTDFFKRIFY